MNAARQHRPPVLVFPALAALAACVPAPAWAQQEPVAWRDLPRVRAVRTATPPTIDGRLDDQVWTLAEPAGGFTQVIPVEGAEPTERTEFRILHDDDYLYVGMRCFDSEPSRIVGTQMRRDGDVGADDRVGFVIDPNLDRRNGYVFLMNPVGARLDGLVEDNKHEMRFEWDGIWEGRATIDGGGWSAEMAIPFKTISFDRGTTTWGFNAARVIRRRTETLRWTAANQNTTIANLSLAGFLDGIEGIRQGVGLDVIPYGAMRYLEDHAADESDLEWDAGIDLFYKLTPSLSAALTINTDFAETEVDERQINITRFPLFFPEKRDFFLQDAGIFSFGGIRFNPLPFHSRRIGLAPDGTRRDIRLGAKVTGRVGGLNLGILDVEMDDESGIGSKNLGVARFSLNVLEESSIGAILTHGDPDTPGDNWVWGTDALYRRSDLFDDRVIQASAFFLQSHTADMREDNAAFGAKIRYPNDRVRWMLAYTEIQENFNAALGFVPRRGIREYFAEWRYRWRPGGTIRRIDSGIFSELVTDRDNQVETEMIRLTPIEIEFESNDTFFSEVVLSREVLDDEFEITDGVIIPADDHSFQRFMAGFATSEGRPVSFVILAEVGSFFDGDMISSGAGLSWRPSRHFTTGLEYEQKDFDLPGGDFTTRIARLRANIYLTPDLSWTTFAQYDNASDTIGINSKIRWILKEGNDLFLVVNQAINAHHTSFRNRSTELISKIGWTFRF